MKCASRCIASSASIRAARGAARVAVLSGTNSGALGFAALVLFALTACSASAQIVPPKISIAVVPFTNAKPDAATDWLGHAASETLALKLETHPAIACVERAAVLKQAGGKLDVQDDRAVANLGKALAADRVVVARYEVTGEDVKFDLRVVDSRAPGVVGSSNRTVKLKGVVDAIAELASDVLASFNKQARMNDLTPEVYDAPPEQRLPVSDAEKKQVLTFARPNYEAFEQFGRGLADPDPFKQIKCFTEALKKDGSFAPPRLYRGFTHLAEKHPEMALDDFDGVIKSSKSWPEPYFRKGQVYESLGRMRLAANAYNSFLDQSKGQRSKRIDDVKSKLKKWQETGVDKKD